MHDSSYAKMAHFVEEYLKDEQEDELQILDIGSMDVNGSYKPLFDKSKWHYQGLDLAQGKNVNIIASSPYRWREVASASMDVVISGQALEHIEYFFLTVLEIERVLKPGGWLCLQVPSGGYEHRYPVDCWRFYPDGLRVLANFCRLHIIQCYAQWEDDPAFDLSSNTWHDAVLIARKPLRTPWQNLRAWLRNRSCHAVLSAALPRHHSHKA